MAVHNVCLPPSVLVFVRVQAWVSHTHTPQEIRDQLDWLWQMGVSKKKRRKKKGPVKLKAASIGHCVCVFVCWVWVWSEGRGGLV